MQEKLSGTAKHTTSFTYDADGSPLTETRDASSATYSYDIRNLLTSVVNKETASDPGKTTSYTYTPTGQIATQTKANGNVVTSTYNLDDSLAGAVEKTSGGTVVSSHTYTYEPNGNKSQDVSVTQNADNHSSDLTATGQGPRINISKWVAKNVTKKLNAYLRGRPYTEGYEDASFGIDFTEPGATPEFKSAVEKAVKSWEAKNGVDVEIRWASEEKNVVFGEH